MSKKELINKMVQEINIEILKKIRSFWLSKTTSSYIRRIYKKRFMY